MAHWPMMNEWYEIMAKAYWIATYRSISNSEALAEYARLSGLAIRAAGGRILVRGMPAKTYEAGIDQPTVVIEFDSVGSAIAAHVVLGDAAIRDIRIVEGVE